MDWAILIVGSIIIAIGSILKWAQKKTEYDFQDLHRPDEKCNDPLDVATLGTTNPASALQKIYHHHDS